MSSHTSAGERKAKKEAAQRARHCLDEKVLHVRVGSWRGTEGGEVESLGIVRDLHGTVCTCCPRRKPRTSGVPS